jgi:hypothetical protein
MRDAEPPVFSWEIPSSGFSRLSRLWAPIPCSAFSARLFLLLPSGLVSPLVPVAPADSVVTLFAVILTPQPLPPVSIHPDGYLVPHPCIRPPSASIDQPRQSLGS